MRMGSDTLALKYVIITPVRDEEQFIGATIDSVCAQTLLPLEWVIVNDGSADRTGQIAEQAAAKHNWIRVVHRRDRGFRKSGTGVVEAFRDGYDTLQCRDWDYVVKLDGDLRLEPEYFERCLEQFLVDPSLGIGGGEILHEIDGEWRVEKNPQFHVRGATKIYRRACWEQIGGLWSGPGWDTIDEVKANMAGWKTHSFTNLPVHHYRLTGSEEGLFRDRIKHGVACYISGYHPMFVLASSIARLTKKPRVIGTAGILYGYIWAKVTRTPRVGDPGYRAYIRSEQLKRLLGMQTIWR